MVQSFKLIALKHLEELITQTLIGATDGQTDRQTDGQRLPSRGHEKLILYLRKFAISILREIDITTFYARPPPPTPDDESQEALCLNPVRLSVCPSAHLTVRPSVSSL